MSKQYRLGEIGTGTLSHDLNRWWHKIRGKEDPYSKVGDVNDRATIGESEYVWALKDINFKVKKGEVLGIIGKNGAGKSTLLKILSKVTGPTTGNIRMKGRVASLLEVGTGFHPELTGRENIYLNGAILGMNKAEVARKLDEIVDFAGVAKYLDTPVKRYSSGMMVRLGFAVAAHLEPEILIVDEVLAVGDADFQKKAVGKMKDVSQDAGRTILFVSHNMAAVKMLCSRAILLKDGCMFDEGHPNDIVEKYLSLNLTANHTGAINESQNKTLSIKELLFTRVSLNDGNDIDLQQVHYRRPISIQVKFDVLKDIEDCIIVVGIASTDGNKIVFLESHESLNKLLKFKSGNYSINVDLSINLLPGHYCIQLSAFHENGKTISIVENAVNFEVLRVGLSEKETYKWNPIHGLVQNPTKWEILKD